MKKRMQRGPFKGHFKNLIVVAAVLCAGLLALKLLTDSMRNIRVMNYSDFIKHVERGDVKSVNIAGQDVTGNLRNGEVFSAVIAYTQKDLDALKTQDVEVKIENTAAWNPLWIYAVLLLMMLGFPLIAFVLNKLRGGSANGGSGAGMFGFGRSRAKMFMPATVKDTFASVAGAAEAKEELKDVIDFLKNPKKFKRLGARIPRGVLLIGEPGNGKTLLARAVAGETNCPFFSISGSDFIEVFVGVGASRVRDLFAQARKHAPSIIFIDEIDAIGRHRGSGTGGGHDEREQTLNQLLTEMDGFQTDGGSVIVMAATNRVDVLDKALMRPGRFDRRVHVPYPDLKSREQILQVHIKGVKISPEVDLKEIARGTTGFSGADLGNLINEAALIASKTDDQKDVQLKDFEEARDKILLGKEIKTIMLTEKDKEVTAYHEAGHALVRLLTPEETDPLYKVTIVPRGAALGVTHSLPEREKYNSSKKEMLYDIMMSLGGRIAEMLVFDIESTGAYSDFQHASKIARAMVCSYGMSDKLGPVVYGQGMRDFVYSQKTAENIDQEVKNITNECYQKAEELLKSNRDKLDVLAKALLEKETLYAGEIYKLLGIEPRQDFSWK